jgi:hypothetical protein
MVPLSRDRSHDRRSVRPCRPSFFSSRRLHRAFAPSSLSSGSVVPPLTPPPSIPPAGHPWLRRRPCHRAAPPPAAGPPVALSSSTVADENPHASQWIIAYGAGGAPAAAPHLARLHHHLHLHLRCPPSPPSTLNLILIDESVTDRVALGWCVIEFPYYYLSGGSDHLANQSDSSD